MGAKVLTDSTAYISDNIRSELDIRRVALSISFNGEAIKETDINNNDFYKMMDEKGIPTSSQPSLGDIYNEMKTIAEEGNDIVCVFLSSDMSGTYSTAQIAKQMILDNYKDTKIEIIDSRSNCMQLGFAAILAAKACKQGKSLEEASTIARQNIKRSRFLFIPDNLQYLKKGGRIGGASALIGNFLKIIPILTVENGETTLLEKVRTKKNAVMAMVERMLNDINVYGLGEIVVHHINCYSEAEQLVGIIKDKVNVIINICDIGPVIGLHVGPGTVGIAYYTNSDMR